MGMRIKERRIVKQEWYEERSSKTGWDSWGWFFEDYEPLIPLGEWAIVEYINLDKFGNPIVGVAEREVEI